MTAVVDASALLALLQSEPGADRVAEALPEAAISAVNLSEVVAKLNERGFDHDQAANTVDSLGLNVVDFDSAQALEAGMLRRATRALGLSLGDRACLALALRRRAPALTTDRSWAALEIHVDVEVIR
jgi:ribonuclease VapC